MRIHILCLAISIIFHLGARDLYAASSAYVSGALFHIGSEEQRTSAVPLVSTSVVVDIYPGFVETTVAQIFINQSAPKPQATYLFPLPYEATLTAMELRYEDRVIRSVVREKEEAKEIFEEAKESGKKAALVELPNPSLFQTSVSNLDSNESVEIRITYIQDLSFKDGRYLYAYPLKTREKYISHSSDNNAENIAIDAAEMVSTGHETYFDINVMGIPISEIRSGTHELSISRPSAEEERWAIEAIDPNESQENELVLNLQVQEREGTHTTVVTSASSEGNFGMVTFFPPEESFLDTTVRKERDIIFLLDRSGSMAGERIESAKKGLALCMDYLDARDRFNIVTFSDEFSLMEEDLVFAADGALAVARYHIAAIESGGGTEMQPALRACLRLFEESDRSKIIVFLTDGAVGNGKELLRLLELEKGGTRIFTFGIGTGTNAYLVNEMAKVARGQSRFVYDDAMISEEIVSLFRALGAPALEDISIEFLDANGNVIEAAILPIAIPDVFIDSPIRVLYQMLEKGVDRILVTASRSGEPIQFEVAVPDGAERRQGVVSLFGQRWVDWLQREMLLCDSESCRNGIVEEIVEASLLFQLVTEYTSRVAVDASDESLIDEGSRIADEEVYLLNPFIVNKSRDSGYRTAGTTSATALNLPLQDLPLSVSVVSQEFIRDSSSSKNLGEYSSYASGLSLFSEIGIFAQFTSPSTEHHEQFVVASEFLDRIDLPTTPTSALNRSYGELRQAKAIYNRPYGEAHREIDFKHSEEGQWGLNVAVSEPLHQNLGALVAAVREEGDTRRSFYAIALDAEVSDAFTVEGRYDSFDVDDFARGNRWEVDARWNPLEGLHLLFSALGSDVARFSESPFLINETESEIWTESDLFFLANFDRRSHRSVLANMHYSFNTSVVEHNLLVGSLISDIEEEKALFHHPQVVRSAERNDRDAFLTYRGGLTDYWAVNWTASLGRNSKNANVAGLEGSESYGDLGLSIEVFDGLIRVFANYHWQETVPEVLNEPYLDPNDDSVLLAAGDLSEGASKGVEAGVVYYLFDGRLSGRISIYDTRFQDQVQRDWLGESNLLASYVAVGYQLASPITYINVPNYGQEGASVSMTWQPIANFSVVASFFIDWEDDVFALGSDKRGGLFGKYVFRDGVLSGCYVGSGVRFRSGFSYSDGYQLEEAIPLDLLIGYTWEMAGANADLQINIQNLLEEDVRLSRFDRDRGVETSVSLGFDF